ncbi:hypothetical protein [Leisingera methylohalidivorans]|uniref:Uncharacterized protein n=1 Tax=Leisingera methylohalidivorans DSM 14336 TaxID=999552 RepID=V9VYW1_9RHOB|nr:hypothetical protein [Leisingera methylohalidivorans]AHD03133.1 hypothetical protein METH_13740 [Leisingera methylohalidivorans DSM 14336]
MKRDILMAACAAILAGGALLPVTLPRAQGGALGVQAAVSVRR